MKRNFDKLFVAVLLAVTVLLVKIEKPVKIDTDMVNIYGRYSIGLLGGKTFEGTVKFKGEDITVSCFEGSTTVVTKGSVRTLTGENFITFDDKNKSISLNLPQICNIEYSAK
ncbi:MAG: hypothetical protein RR253_05665 [Oscillospiraceae bacterium]